MKIEIEGNPGTGNCFTEIHIGNVENYNPNATTVINNNYGTRARPQGDGSEAMDKGALKSSILDYVKKIKKKNLVSEAWEGKYENLWEDILQIKEVDAEIYDRGQQRDTDFNRVLVAAIICILKFNGVFIPKCTDTALAIALEDSKEHHVRQEVAQEPTNDKIKAKVKELIQSKKYTE